MNREASNASFIGGNFRGIFFKLYKKYVIFPSIMYFILYIRGIKS